MVFYYTWIAFRLGCYQYIRIGITTKNKKNIVELLIILFFVMVQQKLIAQYSTYQVYGCYSVIFTNLCSSLQSSVRADKQRFLLNSCLDYCQKVKNEQKKKLKTGKSCFNLLLENGEHWSSLIDQLFCVFQSLRKTFLI